MNCHLPDYYTGVLQSYLVSEEHTQGPKQFTRDRTNSEEWKRAIPRWEMFSGAEWGDGKRKSQMSMDTNVGRVPLLQLHAVLRACFCKVPFIHTVSKPTLQLIKSSVLAICWCAVINHGRDRGKNYIQEMTPLLAVCVVGTSWSSGAGAEKGWPSSFAPLLHGLLQLAQSSKDHYFLSSSHKDWLLNISQTSPPPWVPCMSNMQCKDTKPHTNCHSLGQF